jgi:3D (Asp-Asp-Asp) domain-containing protein|tara:strand:- start:57 stop:605 length:549 start_codon:yes stop_codon:yes gene_type:complete
MNKENNMMTTEKAIAAVIAVTLVNGFFSTTMFAEYKEMYSDKIERLETENISLKDELSHFDKYGIEVDVTMYQPNTIQCDDTPDITADGTKIRINKASEYKFVAMSRNLLSRWGGPFNYGDFILIKEAGHKDGVYQVRDTMNPKWVNVVDILESEHVEPYKFTGVHIFKLNWLNKEKEITNG